MKSADVVFTCVLESRIAWRSDPGPLSFTVETV
jgi:hypothetical protein